MEMGIWTGIFYVMGFGLLLLGVAIHTDPACRRSDRIAVLNMAFGIGTFPWFCALLEQYPATHFDALIPWLVFVVVTAHIIDGYAAMVIRMLNRLPARYKE